MTRPNVLAELGALHLHRPSADAPALVVAAWHEERARVLDHLAEQGAPTAAAAVHAHRHATDLLREAA